MTTRASGSRSGSGNSGLGDSCPNVVNIHNIIISDVSRVILEEFPHMFGKIKAQLIDMFVA